MSRLAPLRLALALASASFAANHAHAFALNGRAWANGDITMQLQLGTPVSSLMDGSSDWNVVAEAALNEWNAQLTRSKFVVVRASTATQVQRNGLNNVFFSADVFGTAWGSGVIGVTTSFRSASTGLMTEADVLFNSTRSWDSYRGPLRRPNGATLLDLRRVALHEFGHALGLDHPDQATPLQFVSAVMNSSISDTDTLQADDIAGAKSLYENGVGPPIITAQPVSQTVGVGGSYTMSVTATGTGPFTYSWGFRAAGSNTTSTFGLATGPSYTIGSVQLADAGTYSVQVISSLALATSTAATLTVTPVTISSDTLLANLSTRGIVGSDSSQHLVAGLVIRGTGKKTVLVRAVGPTLGEFGVPSTLAAPQLRIVDSGGATVAQAGAWGASPDAAKFPGEFTRLGAFQFKPGSLDSAILTELSPGGYTAEISGAGGSTGAALVEAYDADPNVVTARTRRFVNIATRGQVGTGNDVLIAGLVVTGPGPRTYLIRAVGITLAGAPFFLPGALIDPYLQLYQGETLLRENDDWDTPKNVQGALRDAAVQVGAFPLREDRDTTIHSGLDSAMIVTLQPGSYTAKVSGFEGATGLALVEIYEMP